VKHFFWRMAHESHPLRCSLAYLGTEIDTKCPVCGRDNEDGGHLFLISFFLNSLVLFAENAYSSLVFKLHARTV
jgi:hypothetical protein